MPGSLGETEILTLQEMGHTIGSHGWDHIDWTRLDAAGRTREIDGAKTRLSEICGRPVEAASIPFGRYNARVLSKGSESPAAGRLHHCLFVGWRGGARPALPHAPHLADREHDACRSGDYP